MQAFHSDQQLKDQVLAKLAIHREADQIVKGQYWDSGKGCAVGCTLESLRIVKNKEHINHSSHALYEELIGVPQMLARLEDCIFEGLTNGKAQSWPERFIAAIKPGTDLSLVGWKFLHWLLTDETVNPGIHNPVVRDAVKQCADVLHPLTKGKPINESAARSARRAARRAAWSAESAARSAESAARSAAWSAESAARSAAESAAWSAAESAAWSAAWSAARSAAYERMADKIIELIEDAA